MSTPTGDATRDPAPDASDQRSASRARKRKIGIVAASATVVAVALSAGGIVVAQSASASATAAEYEQLANDYDQAVITFAGEQCEALGDAVEAAGWHARAVSTMDALGAAAPVENIGNIEATQAAIDQAGNARAALDEVAPSEATVQAHTEAQAAHDELVAAEPETDETVRSLAIAACEEASEPQRIERVESPARDDVEDVQARLDELEQQDAASGLVPLADVEAVIVSIDETAIAAATGMPDTAGWLAYFPKAPADRQQAFQTAGTTLAERAAVVAGEDSTAQASLELADALVAYLVAAPAVQKGHDEAQAAEEAAAAAAASAAAQQGSGASTSASQGTSNGSGGTYAGSNGSGYTGGSGGSNTGASNSGGGAAAPSAPTQPAAPTQPSAPTQPTQPQPVQNPPVVQTNGMYVPIGQCDGYVIRTVSGTNLVLSGYSYPWSYTISGNTVTFWAC